MNSKNESLEESKNQEINYFRVIWGWKWAAILIPLTAMITAKLMEQPIPEAYETKASIIISGHGNRKPLSPSLFENVAFMPVTLQKIIDQLSLKMADGTPMDQTTLKNQLKTKFPGTRTAPVEPGFLFFIARNENPDLAKKIADLWVQLVEKEAKKIEALNLSIKEKGSIKGLEQRMLNSKSSQVNQYTGLLMEAELKLTEKKSELSTYQKRLRTFSNSKVHFIPNVVISENRGADVNEVYTIIQQDNTALKMENSAFAIETTLHSALKALILKKELEIEALDNKIYFLNTKIQKLKQQLFELTQVDFSGEFLKNFLSMKEAQPLKKFLGKFVSSMASINYAPVIKTPISRERNTHILLAGIISFGFFLLACVLKAHIEAMRAEQK
jgi:hypothetical protein